MRKWRFVSFPELSLRFPEPSQRQTPASSRGEESKRWIKQWQSSVK
jgi:hypothetical protein